MAAERHVFLRLMAIINQSFLYESLYGGKSWLQSFVNIFYTCMIKYSYIANVRFLGLCSKFNVVLVEPTTLKIMNRH
jgi:hypothetical protein